MRFPALGSLGVTAILALTSCGEEVAETPEVDITNAAATAQQTVENAARAPRQAKPVTPEPVERHPGSTASTTAGRP